MALSTNVLPVILVLFSILLVFWCVYQTYQSKKKRAISMLKLYVGLLRDKNGNEEALRMFDEVNRSYHFFGWVIFLQSGIEDCQDMKSFHRMAVESLRRYLTHYESEHFKLVVRWKNLPLLESSSHKDTISEHELVRCSLAKSEHGLNRLHDDLRALNASFNASPMPMVGFTTVTK